MSGAFEGVVDTLLHVQGQGHGRTRVYVQKARWDSQRHGTTLNLVWAEGESYAVEEAEQVTDEDMAERIAWVLGTDPGCGWSKVEEATPGISRQGRRKVRDGLFAARRIVNLGPRSEEWLYECPPRLQSRLYLADDPAIQHLRPAPGAGAAQTAPALGGAPTSAPAPCAPTVGRAQGAQAQSHRPQLDLNERSEGGRQ